MDLIFCILITSLSSGVLNNSFDYKSYTAIPSKAFTLLSATNFSLAKFCLARVYNTLSNVVPCNLCRVGV